MSILNRKKTSLGLLELAETWSKELPDVSRTDLLRALLEDGLDGLYDCTDAGRPGLSRRRSADPSRLDGPIDSYMLRGELAGPPHRLIVPKRFAESLVISKSAALAMAGERDVPPPSYWAEPPTHRAGRKPYGATRDREILREFDCLVAAGEVSFARGGKTAAARAIQQKFADYKVDTIARTIRKAFEERADK